MSTRTASEETGMLSCAQAVNEIYLSALIDGEPPIEAMKRALRALEEGLTEVEEAKTTGPAEVRRAQRRLHEIAGFPTLTLGEKADLRAIATLLKRLAARRAA